MPMTDLFTVVFDSQPDLYRFRRLLDLKPRGRLDDVFDEEFGFRELRRFEDGPIWLSLWRDPWRVSLDYMGADPPAGMVAEVQGEVLAVAGALGLGVVELEPEQFGPVADWAADLPQHRALTVRLAASLSPNEHAVVSRILGLRRDGSGAELGWRYLRRDRTGKLLLQLMEWPHAAELVLFHDREAPTDAIVEACLLQIGAAVAKAGLTVTESIPLPVPGELEWERLGGRMRGARDLDELWAKLGIPDTTPSEVRRGRLLAAIMSSAWRNAPTTLRGQARNFLLGLPTDRSVSFGQNDQWLLD